MEQLIAIGIIKIGDTITFQFKKHTVTGQIGVGGQVMQTKMKGPLGFNLTLQNRIYPSLTAWSEAVLRDGLLEDNCRYASWRRVIHVESGKTLQELRSVLNVDTKGVVASRQDMLMMINMQRMRIEQLSKKPLPPRKSSTQVDNMLMTPHVLKCFNQWASSYLNGSNQ